MTDIEISDLHSSDYEGAAIISKTSLGKEAWKEKDFESAGKNLQSILLSAKADGKLAGYLAAYFAADEAELDSIAVSESFRRLGVGRKLMKSFYNSLAIKGTKNIYLEVRKSNTSAISFYKAEGFEAISKRPRFYEEPLEDAVVMKKELESFQEV